MIVLKGSFEHLKIIEKSSIALGTFDGVHLGHQSIISRAVEEAHKRHLKSVVFTFTEPVFTYFNQRLKNYLITSENVKTEIIKNLNVDYLVYVELNYKFLSLSPDDFLKYLKSNFNVQVIVCGFNYTFGNKAAGDVNFLKENAQKYGIDSIIVDEIEVDKQKVSSSIIRQYLSKGNVELANNLLGYNYYLKGIVTRGKRLASRLGFATANIYIEKNLCLKNGVYLTVTKLGEKYYPSISNVGYNPTFNEVLRVCETHILDFSEDIYNKDIKVEFKKYLRNEIKFNSLEELKRQIKNDVKIARNYFRL